MIKNISAKTDTAKAESDEFEILVKANMRRAYFTALGFLGSHDDAMEISQEAFIKAYRSFSKFEKDKKFFTWYYKILKNLCINFIRDKKRKKSDEFLEYNNSIELSLDIKDDFEKKEMLQKLEESLAELNFEDREIIILKEFENLTYKEIAEVLDIPAGSVMSKLFYARKKLAEKLKRMV